MSTKKKWQDTPVDGWTANIVISYLYDRHTELYGIKYTTRNKQREAGMIRNFLNEYGADDTKRFIDACFDDYKPKRDYPGVNFTFMLTWMKERVLPRVLAEKAREAAYTHVKNDADEDLSDWI